MKISTALPFLILAAAFGPPAHASLQHRAPGPGMQRRSGCCMSYTTANIQCDFMTDYFPRIIGCLLPAVIFKTKKGKGLCAYPRSMTVQHCMEDLDLARKRKSIA